jgi:hypothetical protein
MNLSADVIELTAAHWSHQLSYKYDIDLQLTSKDVSVMLLLMEQAKLINKLEEVVTDKSKTENIVTQNYTIGGNQVSKETFESLKSLPAGQHFTYLDLKGELHGIYKPQSFIANE